jgi:hypothetical protein
MRVAESVAKARGATLQQLRRQLRGDLDNIVLKAMQKSPQNRYQWVEQLFQDVERHLAGSAILARKAPLPRCRFELTGSSEDAETEASRSDCWCSRRAPELSIDICGRDRQTT